MSEARRSVIALGLKDTAGRDVSVLDLPSFAAAIPELLSGALFVTFVAGDARSASGAELLSFARAILAAGAVYAVCWGPNCAAVEEAFDSAAVEKEIENRDDDVIITTSHPRDSLKEALVFLRDVTTPAGAYVSRCRSTLIVSVGKIVPQEALTSTFKRGRGAAG